FRYLRGLGWYYLLDGPRRLLVLHRAWEAFEDVRIAVVARRGAGPGRGVRRQKELTGLLPVVCSFVELDRYVDEAPAHGPLKGTRKRRPGEFAAHVERLEPGWRVTRRQVCLIDANRDLERADVIDLAVGVAGVAVMAGHDPAARERQDT